MENNYNAYQQLREMETVYAEVAAKYAASKGLIMRCEFMCSTGLSGAKKVVRKENDVIVARWASHPFAGEISEFVEDIKNIIDIMTRPNAPIEHKELADESVTIHEDSALYHANKVVQSGRLRYRKTTSLYVQDTLTGLAVTVHSDSLNLWELQSAAHIKLAAYIEKAQLESRHAAEQNKENGNV